MEERPPVWRLVANILQSSRGHHIRGGPPALGSGEMLTNLHSKTGLVTKRIHLTRAWTDPLVLTT